MITESAKAAFDHLLIGALRSGLPVGGARVDVSPASHGTGSKHSKVVVLTVSSYLFRALVVMYADFDAETRAYFNRSAAGGAAPLDDEQTRDRIAECGNVVCGAFNRDLGLFFPHVGMSTPNIIDRACMHHVALLGCSFVKHYDIELENGPSLNATLCVADYGLVDFHVDATGEPAVETGELEMF